MAVRAMSLTGVLLGLINIIIAVVALILVGAVIQWVLTALGWPAPMIVQRLYVAVVALIALAMFIGLLLGEPVHLIRYG
jgi:hypothetical protein